MVDDRIRHAVNVLHYDIAIHIPDQGSRISGSTSIRYLVLHPQTSLHLDFDVAFDVDSITTMQGVLRQDGWRRADGDIEIDQGDFETWRHGAILGVLLAEVPPGQ